MRSAIYRINVKIDSKENDTYCHLSGYYNKFIYKFSKNDLQFIVRITKSRRSLKCVFFAQAFPAEQAASPITAFCDGTASKHTTDPSDKAVL